jgi:hypothetical protein
MSFKKIFETVNEVSLDKFNKRANIKGTDGWELWWNKATGDKMAYELGGQLEIERVPEEDYKETETYFYAKVHSNPDVYSFVSKAVGGAIGFRGKGRWSGNASDFGEELGMPLDDVAINGAGGYAMPVEEIEKIVRRNFSLPFEIKKSPHGGYDITLDWSIVKEGIEGATMFEELLRKTNKVSEAENDEKLSPRDWVAKFKAGEFDSPDVDTQIKAGWYDWFCSDTSLAKRTQKMGNFLEKIIWSPKIKDSMYVWFKNNAPMAVSGTYDDLRLSDRATGDNQYVISFGSPGGSPARVVVYHVPTSVETPAFKGTAAEAIKWFNQRQEPKPTEEAKFNFKFVKSGKNEVDTLEAEDIGVAIDRLEDKHGKDINIVMAEEVK